jgi:Cu+-exporting ATPase
VKAKRKDTPRVVSIVVLGGCDERDLLSVAASLAAAVKHPLAAALLDSSLQCDIELRQVRHFQAKAEEGVIGSVDYHDVTLGNAAFFSELGLSLGHLGDWAERLARQGQRVTFVAVDGETAGFIGMANAGAADTRH